MEQFVVQRTTTCIHSYNVITLFEISTEKEGEIEKETKKQCAKIVENAIKIEWKKTYTSNYQPNEN